MNTRSKSILIYIGGIVTGIILTFLFSFIIAPHRTINPSSNDDIVIFQSPQQEINAQSFEIIQVFPNGDALATVEDSRPDINGNSNFGMVVLFLANEKVSYYDNQKINVSTDKRVLQIGTFRYLTQRNMVKTVPIVEISN